MFFATVVVYNIDKKVAIENVFYQNELAFKELELQIENDLTLAKTMLQGAISSIDEEKMVLFEKDPDAFNSELNRQFLSGDDFKDLLNYKSLPLLEIVPFRWKDRFFLKVADGINWLFDKELPLESRFFKKELEEIVLKIRELGIKPKIDLDRQSISLSRADFKKLDLLDNKLDDIFLNQEIINLLNPRLFDFSLDETLRPASKEQVNLEELRAIEASAIWMACYIYRNSGLLGEAYHTYAELIIHTFNPNPLKSRGQFFRGSTLGNRYAYVWDLFPRSYPYLNDLVYLIPYRVFIGMLDEALIAQNSLKLILKGQGLKDFYIRAEFPDKSILVHNGKEVGSQDGLDAFYISELSSYLLPNTSVFIGQPKILVEKRYNKRWLFVLGLLPLAFLGYVLAISFVKNVINKGFSLALNQVLGIQQTVKNKHKYGSYELSRLTKTMLYFKEIAQLKERELELYLKLKTTLNEPNKSLDWYLEEFYYIAHSFNQNLAFTVEDSLIDQKGFVKLAFKIKDPNNMQTIVQGVANEAAKLVWLNKQLSQEVLLNKELSLAKGLQGQLLGEKSQFSLGSLNFRIFSLQKDSLPIASFCGFFKHEDGVIFYLASVMGRGLGNSLISIYLKNYIDYLLERIKEPAILLNRLNQFLNRHLVLTNIYFGIMVINYQDNQIAYCNAGLYPLIIKNLSQEVEILKANHSPLDLYKKEFKVLKVPFLRGQKLILATSDFWEFFTINANLDLNQVAVQICQQLNNINHLNIDRPYLVLDIEV